MLFPAARDVGPGGQVIGIDLSALTVRETTADIKRSGLRHAEIRQQGVMVPHVQNAAEARSIVEACLYAPKGHRSAFGSGPQLGYAAIPQAEVCKVLNEQTLLMAMIETPEAAENADSIAAVDGIDVLHIGASDLSTEMGIPGQYTHERMRAAFETVARAAKGHSKAMGSAACARIRVPELAITARRALPDRRLRCRLHPQRRPRGREAVTRAEIVGSR